jgi:hypothetical protein
METGFLVVQQKPLQLAIRNPQSQIDEFLPDHA